MGYIWNLFLWINVKTGGCSTSKTVGYRPVKFAAKHRLLQRAGELNFISWLVVQLLGELKNETGIKDIDLCSKSLLCVIEVVTIEVKR